jgi:hypothetical protein
MSVRPDTPLVSIVLPVYNGERYLAESMQSCLDQSYDHWELIVVDDASTDSTAHSIRALPWHAGNSSHGPPTTIGTVPMLLLRW